MTRKYLTQVKFKLHMSVMPVKTVFRICNKTSGQKAWKTEKHRQWGGKVKGLPISKTLVRGRKFKEEMFLTSDSI